MTLPGLICSTVPRSYSLGGRGNFTCFDLCSCGDGRETFKCVSWCTLARTSWEILFYAIVSWWAPAHMYRRQFAIVSQWTPALTGTVLFYVMDPIPLWCHGGKVGTKWRKYMKTCMFSCIFSILVHTMTSSGKGSENYFSLNSCTWDSIIFGICFLMSSSMIYEDCFILCDSFLPVLWSTLCSRHRSSWGRDWSARQTSTNRWVEWALR